MKGEDMFYRTMRRRGERGRRETEKREVGKEKLGEVVERSEGVEEVEGSEEGVKDEVK